MFDCDREEDQVEALVGRLEALHDELADATPDRSPGIVAKIDATQTQLIHAREALATCKACLACIPVYEPTLWNNETRMQLNNCYNYACNRITDTNAVPGRKAGLAFDEGNPTCVELTAALLADGLVHSDAPRCSCAGCSHRVALAIKPAQETSPSDFHLYRQDRDGWWSHKEGGGAVTNLDESGNRIKDPETADRGKYTVFCGFFCVPKVKVEIL